MKRNNFTTENGIERFDVSIDETKLASNDSVETILKKNKISTTFPSYLLRPKVVGKFIYIGDKKFWVKGVTYGTFCPRDDSVQFPEMQVVDSDFAMIAQNGITAVRTYTVPPIWLLDLAKKHNLRVMVGLPWEQHITFLDERKRAKSIEEKIRKSVKGLLKHPAILCYTVGNEIPQSIVRFYGRVRIERFLKRLYNIVKSVDPNGLVAYVNFPTTEYLQLSFFDIICFNVYLEKQELLESYLYRLQNIADNRPLIMAEIGLDSRRNGEEAQAHSMSWQVRTAFECGCAGAFVFSWTDEWHRGGYEIEDWDFGLTTRDRKPKLALVAMKGCFSKVPFPNDIKWPKISVLLCTYNGSRTIGDSLEWISRLDYPDYEVIVVNDGSTDNTAAIVSQYNVRLIETENRGLSSARNTALAAAQGEIVAYIDDDAHPDPHWLKYLAITYIKTDFVAVGGTNILPAKSELVAECVDNAPGGATHVLLSDRIAEHIPGCNMSFRKDILESVGGFDPQFVTAGDDVDVCWKMQKKGLKIGFNAAAVVLHHRRNKVKIYWKQQFGYGKAEAKLEKKWPEKYNTIGHLNWGGHIYGKGQPVNGGRWRVYQGVWGSALFQSIYKNKPGRFSSLSLMPEWYLLIAFLAFMSCIGLFWSRLLFAWPLVIAAMTISFIQAVVSGKRANFSNGKKNLLKKHLLTAYLHLLQPLARLKGRLSEGLTPWRFNGVTRFFIPKARRYSIWSEEWFSAENWLHSVESELQKHPVSLIRGGDFDRWDIEVHGGLLSSTRMLMAIEEHSGGKQMAQFQTYPKFSPTGIVILTFLVILSSLALMDGAIIASLILGSLSLLLLYRIMKEMAITTASFSHVFSDINNSKEKVL